MVVDDPGVRRQRGTEEGVKVVEDLGVLDETLDHLGQLAAADITVLAEKLVLFGEMFARPAPGLDPLLPRRHRRGLDHGGVAGRRPVDPPVGLLLAVRHDLVAALPILVQLELLLGLHRDELPLGPGTLFKPEDNSNLWKGTFMGQKSNGTSQWSFGM